MKEHYKAVLHDSEVYRELAFVIDRTNYIEFTLKSILTKYIVARKDRISFVRDILLHNSIVGLAQKFKLLHYIVEQEEWPKIDSEHFFTVLEIRNAFAHSDTVSQHIDITIRDNGTSEVEDIFQLLETVASSGKYKQIKRQDALDKFTQSYVAVKDYLHMLDAKYAGVDATAGDPGES